jgi:plastocyanin
MVAALAMWSCSGGGSSTPTAPSSPQVTTPPAPTPSARTVAVNIVGSIGNGAYQPNPVAANVGDTVMFRNSDAAMHHIVLDDGSADLGAVAPGGTSRGFTVRTTSAVNYHCTTHPSMVGSINGSTAPEPPPCPDPYGYGC